MAIKPLKKINFPGLEDTYEIDAYSKEETEQKLQTKQDSLISGSNIKTINNESILGEGDFDLATKTYVTNAINDAKLNGDGSGGSVDLSIYATKDYVYDFTERLSGNGLTAISNPDQVIINIGAGDGIDVTEDAINVKLQNSTKAETEAIASNYGSLRPIVLDNSGNLSVKVNDAAQYGAGAPMAISGYLWPDRLNSPEDILLYSNVYIGAKNGTSKGCLLHNAQIAPDAREFCFIEPTWTLSADTTELNGVATLTELTNYYNGLTVSFYLDSNWQTATSYTLKLNNLEKVVIDDISDIAAAGTVLSLTYYDGKWRKPTTAISGEKIVHALTLNGTSYDGSQPVEINLNAPNITQSENQPSGTATVGDIWIVQKNNAGRLIPDEMYVYGGAYVPNGETYAIPVWLKVSAPDLSNYATQGYVNSMTDVVEENLLGMTYLDYDEIYNKNLNERIEVLEGAVINGGTISNIITGNGITKSQTGTEVTLNLNTSNSFKFNSDGQLQLNFVGGYLEHITSNADNPEVPGRSYYIGRSVANIPAVCVPWHDTDVQQDLSSNNEERSILFKGDTGITSRLGSTEFGSDVTINPYTNTISAKGFQVLAKGDTTAAVKIDTVIGEPTIALYTDINSSPTFSIGASGTVSGSTTVRNGLRNFMDIYVQSEEPDAPIGAIWIDTSVSSITYAEGVSF